MTEPRPCARTARPAALALGGLLLAGCSGAPPALPPTTVATPPRSEPTPAPAPAPQAPTPPTPAPGPERLANGLGLIVTEAPAGGDAQVQLGLLSGSDFLTPGLAELAAETLVATGDASQGRASLRQAAARLGGNLHVEVGPQSTWITMRLPANRWQAGLQAITSALLAPTHSRSQIERIRDELVEQRCQSIWLHPDREAARILLRGDAGTGPYLAQLLDRDASEVSMFQARLYRPEFAVLSLHVPGGASSVQAALARSGTPSLAQWSPAPAPAGTVSTQKRRLGRGIHWSPAEPPDRCRVTLLLPLPEITRPDAADLFVMHACVTLDGIGGRLEQLQRERGLGHVHWRSDFVQFAETGALVLTAEATPTEAKALWQTLAAARRSLRELPPTASELQLARKRAMLTARLGEADRSAQMRNHAAFALQKVSPGSLQERFVAIGEPGAFDATRAADDYLTLPEAMLVFGGKPPDDLADVTTFELMPAGAIARLSGANVAAQAVTAVPWLEQTMAASGGAVRLRRFAGFEAEGRLQTAEAPAITEFVRWQADGSLARTREVLGSKVETVLQGSTWTEQVGTQKVALNSREAGLLRREMARHPLALLAAHARGELQFRPVAQRHVGDRDLMILEAIGDRFDRLRLHIDTTSHLVRIVEVWETMADGTVLHLQDAWSDYRGAAGLRVPFRRITEQDDGQNRVECVYSRWTPLLSAP